MAASEAPASAYHDINETAELPVRSQDNAVHEQGILSSSISNWKASTPSERRCAV